VWTDKRAPIPFWNFPFEIGANSGILEIDKRSQIILELIWNPVMEFQFSFSFYIFLVLISKKRKTELSIYLFIYLSIYIHRFIFYLLYFIFGFMKSGFLL
jgi:hypothetical protein